MKKTPLTEEERTAALYSYKAIIDSWSSSQMADHMKDEETAQAVEDVLSECAKLDAAKQQTKPRSEPKAKFKPPVRSQEQQVIEDMSSDEMKRAFSRGRGPAIESILSRSKR